MRISLLLLLVLACSASAQDKRYIILVTNHPIVLTNANTWAGRVHPGTNLLGWNTNGIGTNTWNVPLSQTGSNPPTYFWCNWVMPSSVYGDMTNRLVNLQSNGRIKIYDASVWDTEAVLATNGLKRIETETP